MVNSMPDEQTTKKPVVVPPAEYLMVCANCGGLLDARLPGWSNIFGTIYCEKNGCAWAVNRGCSGCKK